MIKDKTTKKKILVKKIFDIFIFPLYLKYCNKNFILYYDRLIAPMIKHIKNLLHKSVFVGVYIQTNKIRVTVRKPSGERITN